MICVAFSIPSFPFDPLTLPLDPICLLLSHYFPSTHFTSTSTSTSTAVNSNSTIAFYSCTLLSYSLYFSLLWFSLLISLPSPSFFSSLFIILFLSSFFILLSSTLLYSTLLFSSLLFSLSFSSFFLNHTLNLFLPLLWLPLPFPFRSVLLSSLLSSDLFFIPS